jgi:tRNA threonylcarbamoyladenosine biosynthesis protein TsaB
LKVLAVDTSSLAATVAIMDDSTLLGEYTIIHKKTHSQKIMPMINELMNTIEIKPSDIDIYAASSGPGSFTGLRIGITTIKAMAYAVNKPVVSVPTLDALAYNIPMTESLVCPMMDARNNQVYTALYKKEGLKQSKITEYMGISIEELVKLVKGKNHKVVFVGDAVKIHKEYFKRELEEKCEFAPGHLMLQRAASVAQLAFVRANEGMTESCFDMVPFYLRKSQAEREYEKKQLAF